MKFRTSVVLTCWMVLIYRAASVSYEAIVPKLLLELVIVFMAWLLTTSMDWS